MNKFDNSVSSEMSAWIQNNSGSITLAKNNDKYTSSKPEETTGRTSVFFTNTTRESLHTSRHSTRVGFIPDSSNPMLSSTRSPLKTAKVASRTDK